MKNTGTVIYLRYMFEDFMDRLSVLKPGRPLLKLDIDKLAARFAKREPLYEKCADYIVEVSSKSPEEIALEIAKWLSGARN